jgi:hypothetical protein
MSEVEITLNGKTETLRCTLRAAKRVNLLGGFAEVLRKLAVFDFDAYVGVVASGLNKAPDAIEDAVYQTGTVALLEPLSNYVKLLANGGRELATQETAPGEA